VRPATAPRRVLRVRPVRELARLVRLVLRLVLARRRPRRRT
jgi:hypothetical protein